MSSAFDAKFDRIYSLFGRLAHEHSAGTLEVREAPVEFGLKQAEEGIRLVRSIATQDDTLCGRRRR